jgi:orotidine-5'-phosphate decarboxylase
MIMEKSVTLREIIRSLDLADLSTPISHADAIEAATVYAIQLGYPMNAGTGGAYADSPVSESHAEIIADLIAHTDADGVYAGELGRVVAEALGA